MNNTSSKAVVVIPTYNERENIERLLKAIQLQRQKIKYADLSVLVVDDSSPDGTGKLVKEYSKKYSHISLLNGTGKMGLGAAYIRGFQHAIKKLNADVVFEMDADLSHDPRDIPRLLRHTLNGSDFVIGSRYIPGGSIPSNWSSIRKANSRWGNIFARYIAGLKNVKDCTSGFRAIKTNLLKKIDLSKLGVKGYAFQMNLLHHAINKNAVVKELPIQFTDRKFGKSKLDLKDILEFVLNAITLRFTSLKLPSFQLTMFLIGIFLGISTITIPTLLIAGIMSPFHLLLLTVAIISTLMSLQGLISISWMLYAWEDPDRIEKNTPPNSFLKPKHSFTAIIPAKNEENVIQDTIKTISAIKYPERLKEILIICREDDFATILKARATITSIGRKNIRIITFNDYPINKPHALNIGLKKATKDNIVIFDAEDQPHKDIYNIVNTIMHRNKSDVLQSGVQLMNYRSSWFSTMNVLEYFFWFKSTLHFFAKKGIIPLGGNTVFFKKKILQRIGGWDETCLTEDADIGIRLSNAGAKIDVVYSEKHATQEETPHNIKSFIKQRTRWNQGFLQIFLKGEWSRLPKKSQKLLAAYILTFPIIQTIFFLYIPISIISAITIKLPVPITLFAFTPLILMFIQLTIYNIGLYEFTKNYRLKYPLWISLKIMLTYIPFQLLLGFSASRALRRLILKNYQWEKTKHLNAHRIPASSLKNMNLETI